ncbi:hypothetical protein CHELA17_60451 [Chelatococcus asaccharovorans]|nr:hypothetical protein CHELA17_60451 [Chelatococcus asaccharovorans]
MRTCFAQKLTSKSGLGIWDRDATWETDATWQTDATWPNALRRLGSLPRSHWWPPLSVFIDQHISRIA